MVVRLRLLRRFVPAASAVGALFGIIPFIGELVALYLAFILGGESVRGMPSESRDQDEALRNRTFNVSMAVAVFATSIARWAVWWYFGAIVPDMFTWGGVK